RDHGGECRDSKASNSRHTPPNKTHEQDVGTWRDLRDGEGGGELRIVHPSIDIDRLTVNFWNHGRYSTDRYKCSGREGDRDCHQNVAIHRRSFQNSAATANGAS